MKRLCVILLSFLVTSLSVQSVSAENFDFSLAVNNKVQTTKSFNATINVSGSGDVAAVIFIVVFDPSVIEFSSASLQDGLDGKIESACSDGTVTIVFLNSNGETLNSESNGFINLRFKAQSTPCTAYLTIYSQQAVSSDENYLPTTSGIEYPIELQETISGSVSLADGAKVESKSSSAGSNIMANSSTQSTIIEFNNTAQQSSDASFGADSSDGDCTLFIFGFVVAMCVAGIAVAFYALGKKKGKKVLAQKVETPQENQEDKTE